jgi:hypothetical protein
LDRFIERLFAVEDGDLMLCHDHGIAYQKDRMHIVNYDESYFDKCASYVGTNIAEKITDERLNLVRRYHGNDLLCDVGVGSGEFILRHGNAFGVDVNQVAVDWLKSRGLYADDLSQFRAFSFWDVIEHVETPDDWFQHIQSGSWVFASIPVFDDLDKIRQSRHYRPGEHLYYFSPGGFIGWMGLHGFRCFEYTDAETKAGRDSIMSFAFKRGVFGDD